MLFGSSSEPWGTSSTVILEYLSAAKSPVNPHNTHSQQKNSQAELQENNEESFHTFNAQSLPTAQQQPCDTENKVGHQHLIPHLSKQASDALVPTLFQPKV